MKMIQDISIIDVKLAILRAFVFNQQTYSNIFLLTFSRLLMKSSGAPAAKQIDTSFRFQGD